LDELLRVGAVKQLKDGRICLLSRGYIPQKGPVEKLQVLGRTPPILSQPLIITCI
jgi:hypothetical protein